MAAPTPAQSSGTWARTGSLNTARAAQTATLLLNGQVLVAGGEDANSKTLATAELYDPSASQWSTTGCGIWIRRNGRSAVVEIDGARSVRDYRELVLRWSKDDRKGNDIIIKISRMNLPRSWG